MAVRDMEKTKTGFGDSSHSTRTAIKILAILTVAFISVSLNACAGFTVRAGNYPDMIALQELTVGQSASTDVERVLGKPFGTGLSYLPFQDSSREMWMYYYEEGTLEDDRRIFLFVYLDDGVLDGYMWFSSLDDAGR